MNIVKNNAKETITILGGVVLVANALRVIESTTIILVNDVIIIKIDGARESTVIRIITLNILAVVEPVGASATFMLKL